MFTRKREETKPVEWGNGLSYRFVTQSDNLGFTLAHTIVRAGTTSRLEYREHLEACYCIAGRGAIETEDGEVKERLTPGTLYALDQHDRHLLIADEDVDLELVSVFNPPLVGQEAHRLDALGYSSY